MTTKNNWQILVLAAATLLVAACDPFPSKPGGDPSVVRVTTYDGSVSNTVERTTGAAGTVATDLATPFSAIFVQFNKPMDGSSIQAANTMANGVLYFTDATDQCLPAAGVSLTGFTANTSVCDYSSSPTDGGQMAIWSQDPLVLGDTYTVTGSVKDYEGKSLPVDVTVQVDDTPFAVPSSNGYTISVFWWERAVPGAYTLETAPDASGAPGTWTTLGAATCDGIECVFTHNELEPLSGHWYRLTEAGQTRRQIGAAVFGTSAGRAITLANVAVGGVVQPGQLRATWSSITGATGYLLERKASTDTAWVDTGYTGTTRNFVSTGLTSGTTYEFRVRPLYADLVVVSPGPVASRIAP